MRASRISVEATATRRQSHLLPITTARVAQLQAEDDLQRAIQAAKAGGVSAAEIVSHIAMIDRAAGR